jgi:hypothetical protein
MMARYGMRPPPATPTPQAAPPVAPKAAKLPPGLEFIQNLKSFDGTWTRADGRYLLGVDAQGMKASLDASVNETGRLTWTIGSGERKFTVFFVRTS